MRPTLLFPVLVAVLTPVSIGKPINHDAHFRQRRDEEHTRQKRFVLKAIKEVGCGAYTAVRECTSDLESCGQFCAFVDLVCDVVSMSSGAVSQLCNTDVGNYENTVLDDYRQSNHASRTDAERFIMKLGEDIEHLVPKSFWEKLANFFKTIWKTIRGWFS
ncbi:uncharacterized protein [Haliotis cracherodii]|uniref:uncharacterized protein n=1 Tax=Haliotis cracherodii TaxID=6455 RepID=UPI0039EADD1D